MKIAICGIRGIPACYGGFETFAEELSTRLVEKGHEVVVYGRSHVISHKEPTYRGVNIRLLPAPRHKYFETILHSLLCFFDISFRRADVVLVCNAANSPFIWILRLAGLPVVVNLDGIERKRAKWNAAGRWWYKLGEITSVKFASKLVADAEVIADYYLESYGSKTEVIRYGHSAEMSGKLLSAKLAGDSTSLNQGQNSDIFGSLGIEPDRYILYVSRLEPENNAHVVIAAYNSLSDATKSKMPLVVVGDAPYAPEYIQGLKANAGGGVIFAGFRFGDDYVALQRSAYLYVQATEVGGTHPALVEAMGFANCVIANETPENVEVLGTAGLYYEKNNSQILSERFEVLLKQKDLVVTNRKAAYERAKERFDWGQITCEYEELFKLLTAPTPRGKTSISTA